MAEPILGFHVPIQRGVWQRILTGGVPRFYAKGWACFWLMVGLILLTYYGWRWLILPVFCWLIGHGILVWLTQWNQHFDDMFFAQVNRKYKARYSAG